MSKIVTSMTREEVRRRLAAQTAAAGGYVHAVDPRIDPNLISTTQASQLTGLSNKKLLRLAEQGKLWLLELSERCRYFNKEEIFALATQLDRLPASPPLEEYYSRIQAA